MHFQEEARQEESCFPQGVSRGHRSGDREPIPKIVSTDSMKFTLKDGGFRVNDYGNVMVAKKVRDELGLLEDLSMSFAGAERPIMCLAIAQALSPTPFMDTELTLESTYIRETIGIGEMDFSS